MKINIKIEYIQIRFFEQQNSALIIFYYANCDITKIADIR